MMTAGGRERWEAGLRMIRDHLPGMVDGWEVQAARLVEGLQIGVGGTAWLVGVVMDGMGGTRTMDGQTHEVMQDGILRPVDGMIKVGNLAGPKQLVMLDGIVHKNLDITMGWTGVVCAEPGNVDNTPEMTRKEVGGRSEHSGPDQWREWGGQMGTNSQASSSNQPSRNRAQTMGFWKRGEWQNRPRTSSEERAQRGGQGPVRLARRGRLQQQWREGTFRPAAFYRDVNRDGPEAHEARARFAQLLNLHQTSHDSAAWSSQRWDDWEAWLEGPALMVDWSQPGVPQQWWFEDEYDEGGFLQVQVLPTRAACGCALPAGVRHARALLLGCAGYEQGVAAEWDVVNLMQLTADEEQLLSDLHVPDSLRADLRGMMRLQNHANNDQGPEFRWGVQEYLEAWDRGTGGPPGGTDNDRAASSSSRSPSLQVRRVRRRVGTADAPRSSTDRVNSHVEPVASGEDGERVLGAQPQDTGSVEGSSHNTAPDTSAEGCPSSVADGGGANTGAMDVAPGDASSLVQRLQTAEAQELTRLGVRRDTINALGLLLDELAAVCAGEVQTDVPPEDVQWGLRVLDRAVLRAEGVQDTIMAILVRRIRGQDGPCRLPEGEARGGMVQMVHRLLIAMSRTYLDDLTNNMVDGWLNPEVLLAELRAEPLPPVLGRADPEDVNYGSVGGYGEVVEAPAVPAEMDVTTLERPATSSVGDVLVPSAGPATPESGPVPNLAPVGESAEVEDVGETMDVADDVASSLVQLQAVLQTEGEQLWEVSIGNRGGDAINQLFAGVEQTGYPGWGVGLTCAMVEAQIRQLSTVRSILAARSQSGCLPPAFAAEFDFSVSFRCYVGGVSEYGNTVLSCLRVFALWPRET
ncbi:yipf6, partial [Symbiodinium sp. KB8]